MYLGHAQLHGGPALPVRTQPRAPAIGIQGTRQTLSGPPAGRRRQSGGMRPPPIFGLCVNVALLVPLFQWRLMKWAIGVLAGVLSPSGCWMGNGKR